jgi:hypothetical protein
MNNGSYVFTQLIKLLPKEAFDWIVKQYDGDKYVKHFTCWNQLLVMMFGQLYGCERLRELVIVISAHSRKSYHLGFGKEDIKLANLAKANANRDYRIFEEFARRLIEIAQSKRIDAPFDLNGKFYAFDSTTIDLCLSFFWWAKFRSTKSGIKAHTLFDVVTQIPAYINITNANVHDTQAMDDIPYEPNAYYIFDRGYFDLARLYKISIINSYFIIRQKGRLQYKIVDGEDLVEGIDGVISDQTIELTGYQSRQKYPGRLRRILYYSKELKRTFTYITNAFYIKAKDIAMLYKKRWQVELFFKWIKQHLYIKSFWGNSENAVRIQIYCAISAYCLVAIAEHDCRLNRSMFDALRILRGSLIDRTPIRELFEKPVDEGTEICIDLCFQLSFNF